uniref:Uncharacterized protein n=1 Tax=Anopheles melas TaxID=34690 RepID=A0A182TVX0_9DIPT
MRWRDRSALCHQQASSTQSNAKHAHQAFHAALGTRALWKVSPPPPFDRTSFERAVRGTDGARDDTIFRLNLVTLWKQFRAGEADGATAKKQERRLQRCTATVAAVLIMPPYDIPEASGFKADGGHRTTGTE